MPCILLCNGQGPKNWIKQKGSQTVQRETGTGRIRLWLCLRRRLTLLQGDDPVLFFILPAVSGVSKAINFAPRAVGILLAYLIASILP